MKMKLGVIQGERINNMCQTWIVIRESVSAGSPKATVRAVIRSRQ